MGIVVASIILVGVIAGIGAFLTGQLVVPPWFLGASGFAAVWLFVGAVTHRPSRLDIESEYHTRASAIDAQIQTLLTRAVANRGLSKNEKSQLSALFAAREANNETWKG